MTEASQAAGMVQERMLERNRSCERFFAREADRLARACEAMAARFQRGGRLLAFGRGVYVTDAQHVSVEFIHPVIVGKRALPAMDVSLGFDTWLDVIVKPADIVMCFGPPGGDPEVIASLDKAQRRGAMVFALPGHSGDYAVPCFADDPFLHQEMIEMLYHTLWETVHVFLEHQGVASSAGNAGFLYPFLDGTPRDPGETRANVANSIRTKVAEDARLREQVAREQPDRIAQAASIIASCVKRGGKLILFGNGGSATDANDWALDCVCPPSQMRPMPAVSLSNEPAVLTALANDVGADVIFLRQLIAHAQVEDVVVGISTSGGSRNLLLAFEEARRRRLPILALLGYDGGEVVRRSLADVPVVVHCDYIPRIQEVQASIYHVIRELTEVLRDG